MTAIANIADIISMAQFASNGRRKMVSEDARNSIYLWVGGLAFFGLFWGDMQLDLFRGVSDTWLWPLLGIIAVIEIARTGWLFWKRRATNLDKETRG